MHAGARARNIEQMTNEDAKAHLNIRGKECWCGKRNLPPASAVITQHRNTGRSTEHQSRHRWRQWKQVKEHFESEDGIRRSWGKVKQTQREKTSWEWFRSRGLMLAPTFIPLFIFIFLVTWKPTCTEQRGRENLFVWMTPHLLDG